MKKSLLLPFLLLLLFVGCEKIPDATLYHYPTRGLVAHYRFENNLLDSYGDNNSWVAPPYNKPVGWDYGDGIIGKDFRTNSICRSAYDIEHNLYVYDTADVDIHSGLINGNKLFSVSLWFKCTSWRALLQSAGMLMWQDKQYNNVMSLDILGGFPASGCLILRFNDEYIVSQDPPVTVNSLVAIGKYADNQWHHVVIAYDGSTIFLYVDNLMMSGRKRVDLPDVSSVFLGIGNFYYFPGEVDELYFYNVCLTSDEVNQLWSLSDLKNNS
jgi:hypothetical protein